MVREHGQGSIAQGTPEVEKGAEGPRRDFASILDRTLGGRTLITDDFSRLLDHLGNLNPGTSTQGSDVAPLVLRRIRELQRRQDRLVTSLMVSSILVATIMASFAMLQNRRAATSLDYLAAMAHVDGPADPLMRWGNP